jgi:hypothetical protein
MVWILGRARVDRRWMTLGQNCVHWRGLVLDGFCYHTVNYLVSGLKLDEERRWDETTMGPWHIFERKMNKNFLIHTSDTT